MSIFIGGLFVSINIKLGGGVENWITALRQGFFQVVSIGTTTGFANADSSVWPSFSILLLIYFMFQCACSGSTTGGLKADRVFIFLSSLRAQLKKQVHPNAIVPIKVNNHSLEREMVYSVNLYIGVYVSVVFLVTLSLSLMGIDMMDSFSASAAAMGNVGPGFGSVGSLGNYSGFPVLGKLLLTLQMLLGRLEIYPIMLMFVVFRSR